jgi:hypothetical protein
MPTRIDDADVAGLRSAAIREERQCARRPSSRFCKTTPVFKRPRSQRGFASVEDAVAVVVLEKRSTVEFTTSRSMVYGVRSRTAICRVRKMRLVTWPTDAL